MRVLVTGSHGFAGRHLRAALREAGATVIGTGRSAAAAGPGETYVAADLTDAAAIRGVVQEASAERVFHLAAGTGQGGVEAAQGAIDTNVIGTRNLCAALAETGRLTRLIHVGSSAQYGAVPDHCDPVDEDAPQLPLGVYGASKVASEAIALSHQGMGGLEVVAVRPFNHTGPGEPPHLVVAAFAQQVAGIEAGQEPVIHVGNVAAIRDLTDVRDLVLGYLAAAERGTPGRVYNLCSGRGTRVEEVLGMLLDKSEATIEVRADPDRTRPVELMRQVGNPARAESELGWTARIDLSSSVDAVLREWRERLGATTSKGSHP